MEDLLERLAYSRRLDVEGRRARGEVLSTANALRSQAKAAVDRFQSTIFEAQLKLAESVRRYASAKAVAEAVERRCRSIGGEAVAASRSRSLIRTGSPRNSQ